MKNNISQKETETGLGHSEGGTSPPIYLPDEIGINTFPADLAALPASGFWKYAWSGEKWTKPPCNIHGSRVDRGSFKLTLRQAREQASSAGLGVGINPPEGYVALDFDDCFAPGSTAASLKLKPPVEAWVRRFDSYAEFFPSGKGIHLWIKAKKPDGAGSRRDSGPFKVEIYGPGGNYLTVTGVPLAHAPLEINEGQRVLNALCADVFNHDGVCTVDSSGSTASIADDMTDEEILTLIMKSDQASKFARLFYDGDLTYYGDDHSSADAALCSMLAFWLNKNAARIDHWFRFSGLMRPKWDKQRGSRTYGELTISFAIRNTSQTFGSRPEYTPATELDVEQFIASVIGGRK